MNRTTDLRLPPISIIYWIATLMSGLILPAVLIPIVAFTGYSEIVEEIAKTLVVYFILLRFPTHTSQIIGGIIFGFLFGLSENIFYLNQIFQLGDMSVFSERFLLTLPMHIVTVLIILLSGIAGKIFLIFGFISSTILHMSFNGVYTAAEKILPLK